MNINKLTKKEALEQHVKLWDWLAENPGKYKHDWPSPYMEYIKNDCFACEYSKQNKSFYCNEDCIIPIFAEQENCVDDDSVYSLWSDALFDDKKGKDNRIKYAKIIANSGREALVVLNKKVK